MLWVQFKNYASSMSITSSWLISSGLLWITETPLTSLSSSPTWTNPVRRGHRIINDNQRGFTESLGFFPLYQSYLNTRVVVRSTDTSCLRSSAVIRLAAATTMKPKGLRGGRSITLLPQEKKAHSRHTMVQSLNVCIYQTYTEAQGYFWNLSTASVSTLTSFSFFSHRLTQQENRRRTLMINGERTLIGLLSQHACL